MEWIKIDDNLPNTGICTDIWITDGSFISRAYIQNGKIYSYNHDHLDEEDIKRQTHWIREESVPLPGSTKWISVKKRLPNNKEKVLVLSSAYILEATFNKNKDPEKEELEEYETKSDYDFPWEFHTWDWCSCCTLADSSKITHWMPLPEQPKE